MCAHYPTCMRLQADVACRREESPIGNGLHKTGKLYAKLIVRDRYLTPWEDCPTHTPRTSIKRPEMVSDGMMIIVFLQ